MQSPLPERSVHLFNCWGYNDQQEYKQKILGGGGGKEGGNLSVWKRHSQVIERTVHIVKPIATGNES